MKKILHWLVTRPHAINEYLRIAFTNEYNSEERDE